MALMEMTRRHVWSLGLAGLAAILLTANCDAAAAAPQMTDQSISDKIDDELLMDPGVISSKVDISTDNGVVTLTGQVNNILAKERAERVAEAVKGVRSIVNRIKVKPSPYRTDAQIKVDVQNALLEDPAADSYELSTSVENGVVTLSGDVDSYQEAKLAKTVAKGVRGVVGIDDQIDVIYKVDRTDAEVKREIEESLRWNVYVDDDLINVAVDDGKVTLSGTIGSLSEKRMSRWAAWVAGTKAVDASNLTVERWARDDELRGDKYVIKSEDEMKDALQSALLRDPRVMMFNVDVDIAGSVATLRGTVDNLKAKRAAEQDAKNTVGITRVYNRLKVRFDDPITDVEISDKITDAFVRDPYIERFDITTTVVDGTAYLYGTVDTYFEKNRADDLASRVNGVVDVENHLAVDYEAPYIFDPYVDDDFIDSDELFQYEPRAPGKTDSQIKKDIESELWWSPFVDADEVDVSVDDGVALLTGTVDSWSERRSATQNAYEAGATLVDNDLTVSYSN